MEKISPETYDKYIKALMDVSRAITCDLYFEDILKLIVMVTAKVTGVEICSLWLVDESEDPKKIRLKATQAIDPDYVKDRALDMNEGVNVSTGKQKFMDGAQFVTMGYHDFVMGNGSSVGYGKTSMNGDAIFWKYQSEVVTTLSPEGKPLVTFEGSYTFTKGTGKYEGIQGRVTYKGEFISRTIWLGEWEGEYFIKK